MGRRGKVTLTVKAIDFSSVSEEAIIASIGDKVVAAFADKLAPQVVDNAKGRAPVSHEQNFNPQPKSFSAIRLRSVNEFANRDAETRFRRVEIESLLSTARGNARLDVLQSSDIRFFRGTGKHKKQTPDQIDVRHGGLVGAFKHQSGTLRDSIKFDGIRRQGNTITATIRAHAPYAWYVHQGFNHKGGKRVKGRKFLSSALVNIRSRLTEPSTYEG